MTIDTSWIPAQLEPVALRLARADQLIFEVGKLSLEWSIGDSNSPITLHQVEQAPGFLSLVVAKVRPVPPAVSMLFSETINHLRAAIDNTVFHIVEEEQGPLAERIARRVSFPTYDDPSKFERWLHENDKVGLTALGEGSRLASRIRALQPFEDMSTVQSIAEPLATLMGIEPAGVHPLVLLQAYSNDDKHRAIRSAAARTMIQRDDEPFRSSDRSMRPLQPGDVLATTAVGEIVMIDSNAAVHVARPGGAEWVSPSRELDHLRAHVAEVVIPTLMTGLSIPRAFPPNIDLEDTGQTDRERINAGEWKSAHERMAVIAASALLDALSAQPTVPPIVPTTPDFV